MGLISSFLDANRRLSLRFTPEHIHEWNVFGAYKKIGTILLSHPKVSRVADLGAGRSWHFPTYYKDWYKIVLVGIDIDGQEMKGNTALDQQVVCDVVQDIPLPDGDIDLLMIDSGIEHFSDNERFLRNAFRVLKPGGFLLAQFPSRYAPFAMANRLLPRRLSRRVLSVAMGETEELGFRAYYDRTNYPAFKELFTRIGFSELYYLPGHFSSLYFARFFPLYLLSYVYDTIRFSVGARDLASYNLFVLQKPDNEPTSEPLRLYAWR